MTQEEKNLLLQDLCARLPYSVIVYDYERKETREMGLGTLHDIMFNDLECKPYLRPMSSMTEEEIDFLAGENIILSFADWDIPNYEFLDFLNSHHFDYRGLIEKGLALEAQKGMYNLEKK